MFEALGKFGFSIGLGILTSLYYGWALMTIWGWFFVTGAGMATMPYIFWVGIPLLWGQLNITTQSMPKTDKNGEETGWLETTIWSILKVVISLIVLGFAWILFMILI